MRKKSVIFLLAILSLLCACNSSDKAVIPEQEMVDLLIDIHKSEAVMALNYNKFSNEDAKRPVREAVFMRHHTSQAEFDSALVWYGNHLEDYMEIYQQVLDRLNEENEQIKALIAEENTQTLTAPGDTVDIWKRERAHVFNASKGENIFTFNINSDENFFKNDRFILKIRAHNVPHGGAKAQTYLAIIHKEQNIHYNVGEITNDGWTTMTIQSDSAIQMNNIYGYIALPHRPDRHIMYVDSIILLRIHEKPGMPEYSYQVMETLSNRIKKRPSVKEKAQAEKKSAREIIRQKLTPRKIEREVIQEK